MVSVKLSKLAEERKKEREEKNVTYKQKLLAFYHKDLQYFPKYYS